MEEMINNKNKVLLEGAKKLRDVGKIAKMLEGVDFDNVTAAKNFMEIVAASLRDLSYFQYTMRDEADKATSEAKEVPEDETSM